MEFIIIFSITSTIIAMISSLIVLSRRSTDDMKFKEKLYSINEHGRIKNSTLFYKVIKRYFDIVISSIALLLFAPILCIIACAIKISGETRIITFHDCIGRNGKIIRYPRFNVVGNTGEYTGVGIFLLKTELDKIPMLLAILSGKLTIIGLSRITNGQIDEDYLSYFNYEKPGLISLSKVAELKELGEKTIDLIYLKGRSLFFDLRCLGYVVRNAKITTGG